MRPPLRLHRLPRFTVLIEDERINIKLGDKPALKHSDSIFKALDHLFFILTSKPGKTLSFPPPMMAASLLLIMALWSGYLFSNLLFLPACIGLVFAIFIGIFFRERRDS